jgi:hypothetical protein
MERERSYNPEEQIPSPVRRVVGLSDGDEKEIMGRAREQFQHPEKLSFEREKTERERRIIDETLSRLPEFLKQYGLNAVGLTSDHIHIADEGKLTPEEKKLNRVPDAGGYYMEDQQAVVVFPLENDLRFMERFVHESLHANSFSSFTYSPEKGYKLRRSGFVIDNEKEDRYFHDLNEGLIEELTKRFDKEYSGEMQSISEAVARRKDFIDSIKTRNPDADTDDISSVVTKQKPDGMWETKVTEYVYEEERSELRRLIQHLYEQNPTKFNSPEDVFKIFVQATFTGRLLEVARLIEDSLGKGSFRKIAEKTKWEAS